MQPIAGPGDRAQLQHRLRAVDHEPGMHLDGDLHAVIFGELRLLGPVRRRHFVPLPVQDFQILRRPRAGDPVRVLGVVADRRGSREKSITTGTPSFSASRMVFLLVS